jgi:hypothetical protein
MNWGKWIVVSFILFAVFIGVLVAVCVRQDINLVADDYYKQELDYQKQIERLNNAHALAVKPVISVANSSLQISFKDFNRIKQGELTLFRPSDASADLKFEMKITADTIQSFDIRMSPKGMYKAQLKWSMDEKEYYFEETIYL